MKKFAKAKINLKCSEMILKLTFLNNTNQTYHYKMAATMDVDSPANNGASKKRFEVKKVCMSDETTAVILIYNKSASLNVSNNMTSYINSLLTA